MYAPKERPPSRGWEACGAKAADYFGFSPQRKLVSSTQLPSETTPVLDTTPVSQDRRVLRCDMGVSIRWPRLLSQLCVTMHGITFPDAVRLTDLESRWTLEGDRSGS